MWYRFSSQIPFTAESSQPLITSAAPIDVEVHVSSPEKDVQGGVVSEPVTNGGSKQTSAEVKGEHETIVTFNYT